MAGIEELVAQMTKFYEQQVKRDEQQEKRDEKQAKLLESFINLHESGDEGDEGGAAGGSGAAAAAAIRAAIGNLPIPAKKTNVEIRKDKISQLHQLLRKSHKLKDYKTTSSEHIKEWLLDFDEEISNIATLSCNLDLNANPLTREEYVAILRDKLASCAKKELNRAFEASSPKLEWSSVTIVDLKKVLLSQFGDKEPDITSVFNCFNENRFKKPKDMKIRKYYAQWRE